MNDVPKNPKTEMLKCPLCEGRGELCKADLVDRLSEKDLGHKVENYMAIVEAETNESLHAAEAGTKESVTAWNLTHFLWRRSPKE
ncbi:MAG TPA: hypothetical protein VN577_13700 [Terriglobales bacterium]|nr:hypothetical protein [Terriglobales bacterium]